jgi:formylglycine-generating enzyme
MPHRLGPVAILVVSLPACAGKVAADEEAQGSTPEGGASLELGGVDSGASPLAVAIFASGSTEVCAGQCVELTATATGGRPPYSYAWSGGLPPAASAQVCPATTETVTVVSRDASGSSGEVPRPAAQASASVTVTVDSSCSGDGGIPGSLGGDDDAAAANVDAGAEGDACSPGITRCSGADVETCLSSGQWGSPRPCATGACSLGSCAGSTTAGASCQPGGNGLTDCGPSGESCCTSLEVAGGTYYRTYTNTGSGPTGEADPATISGFRLDKYLVTVGRFRSFVAAWSGGYAPPAGSGKHAHLNAGEGLANSEAPGTFETGWLSSDDANLAPTDANLTTSCSGDTGETWTATAGNNESLPITCANWYEAYAFCIWDGGFLPSEAEWEYAAAGGSEQREYPWASTDPGTSSQYAIYDCNYGLFCADYGIAPVGTASLGAGRWGQLDMAGEVWEWNMDWFVDPYADPCTDCAYLGTSGAGRGLRGGGSAMGAWLYAYRQVDPPDEFDTPTTGGDDTGFRCARSP